MNTGKIAFIMLRKRWKFVITIIFTMVISASSAILTVILADSFYMQKKNLAFQNYGSFINRFYELDQKTCEKLHRHSGLQTGFFELYGNATVESADLTIGHVDETYQTLTNMYLEEGRWPENRQEVAMERFAAELFGVSGVDEWITVSMGKKDWIVKVTGIVRNYSSRLMLITPVQKGINNYPAIFCMENSVLKPRGKPVSQSALITFSNPDVMSWNQAITYQKMEQLLIEKEIPVSNSYTNDLLYVKGLKYCGEIIICTWVFSVIVSAAAILCCLRLFAVFYKDYDKKSAVIRVLGGQKKIMMQVLSWQSLFLLGTSLILCLVEILILRYLIPGVFMEGYWKESYLLIFLVWFVLFGIIVESWLFFVLKQSFQGPIRKVFTGYEQGIHSGKYLKRNYNLIRGLRSPDKAACILFVLLFLISSFALSNIYLAEIDDGTSDYQIAASWIEAVEVKDNYVIKRGTTDSISWDSYFRLQEDKSYVCMDTVPDLKKGTLLLSPGQCTDYFKEWISQNEEKPTTVMNSEVDKYWPAEAETWIPIPCVEFVIVDALQMAEIAKKWDLQKEEEQEGILLFLPEYSDVENTALKKGDRVHLGGVVIDEMEEHAEERVRFQKQEILLKDVIADSYTMKYQGVSQSKSGITAVISQEYAKRIFPGIEKTSIFLRKEISSTEQNNLEKNLYEIVAKLQGGLFYSKYASQKAEREYNQYLVFLGSSVFVVVSMLSGILIVAQSYQMLYLHKKRYGILRLLGMSTSQLSRNICCSCFSSMLISFGIDICLLLFLRLWIPYIQHVLMMLLVPWGVVFLVTMISIVESWIFFRTKTIKELIYEKE